MEISEHLGAREDGEPARIRTVDILIKSQALYQLSYGLSQQTVMIGGCIGKHRLPVKRSYAQSVKKSGINAMSRDIHVIGREFHQTFSNVICLF